MVHKQPSIIKYIFITMKEVFAQLNANLYKYVIVFFKNALQ